jgi:serine/threonine-protein kinase
MGTVWAATHTLTGKGVALKLLRERTGDEAQRKRLLREARAACSVQHPNVVTVHDVLELADGAPALVMDLLSGESLGERLERTVRIPPLALRGIMGQVLSALEAAHARGIVHRDLKPDNIFLMKPDDAVRVLDFGIAKVSPIGQEGNKESAALTGTGAMLGTPYYMAPEQAFGEKDVDLRSDIWALGVVMYECLSGVRPTEGANLGQILKIITVGKIQPLAEVAPDVSPSLSSVVMKCLERDRGARPQSIAELRALLEKVAADTMSGTEIAPKPTPRRSRLLVPALAALLVAFAAVGTARFVASARSNAHIATLAPTSSARATSDPSSSAIQDPSVGVSTAVIPTLTQTPTSSAAPSAPIQSPPAAALARSRHVKPAADGGVGRSQDVRGAGHTIITPPF